MKIVNLELYINSLTQITDAIIDLTDFDQTAKSDFKEKIINCYTKNIFDRFIGYSSKEEIANIYSELPKIDDNKLINRQILTVIFQKVEYRTSVKIAVEELEKLVKEIMQITSDVLSVEEKHDFDKFIQAKLRIGLTE